MKRMIIFYVFFSTLAAIILSGCASISGTANLDNKLKNAGQQITDKLASGSIIAVFSFYSPSEKLSEYLLEELSAYLVSTNKFSIVERKHLDEVRKELNFQLSGEVSDETAQSIGKMLGAQYIVIGVFSRIGNSWKLRTNTIHVETAKKEVVTSTDVPRNKNIDFLINNATPLKAEDDIKSKFDGSWRSGATTWTFDNNIVLMEMYDMGFIPSGTFMFNETNMNITLYKLKEHLSDPEWANANPPVTCSFQYAINGNKMLLDGYLGDGRINAILTRD
jgi:hypothetical protein